LQCADVKDELDAILKSHKKPPKVGRKLGETPHRSVPRVSLGNTHNRIPNGTLWPFMLSQDWYDENVKGNKDLETAISIHTKNPDGFGDDTGYVGDDEGLS
jgi:hypothetical protein